MFLHLLYVLGTVPVFRNLKWLLFVFIFIFSGYGFFVGERICAFPHTTILEVSNSQLILKVPFCSLSDYTLNLEVCKLYSLDRICPIFLHEVSLENIHAHLFTYFLCLTELSNCYRDSLAHKARYLVSGPLQKKNCQPLL